MHKIAIVNDQGIITNIAIGEVGSVPNSQFISTHSSLRIGDKYDDNLAKSDEIPPKSSESKDPEIQVKPKSGQSVFQKIMQVITPKS